MSLILGNKPDEFNFRKYLQCQSLLLNISDQWSSCDETLAVCVQNM
jgi:hypothetical protein